MKSLVCPLHRLPFAFWDSKDIAYSKGIYSLYKWENSILPSNSIQTCNACGKFPNKKCYKNLNLQPK